MNKKLLKTTFWLTLYGLITVKFLQAQNPDTSSWEIVYDESFTDVAEGELPEKFFVLDGDFQVIEKEGNKCLELKGKPVGEHGFLYGPRLSADADSFEVSFSCLGAVKSRRHSVFAGSLGGIRGLTFRTNPVSKKLLLAYSEEIFGEVWLSNWSSSDWMQVVIHINPQGYNFECEIFVSRKKDTQKAVPLGKVVIQDKIKSGRCALWGFAYAEKEMYWDDLKIRVPQ